VAEALADLFRLVQERPELAGPAGLLTELLPRLFQEPIQAVFPSLKPKWVRRKLLNSMPVLRGESFEINQQALHRRLQSLCDAVARHEGSEAASAVRVALDSDRLNAGEFLSDILAGHPDALQARAEALGLEPGLTSTLLRLLLVPVLSPLNAAWAPERQDLVWKSGWCPTCGGWPLIGELRQGGPERFLRCGLCTAEWAFSQTVCPLCDTDDARFLSSLRVPPDNSQSWAATCGACRGYVKMVSTARPLSGPQLLVMDLATMYLDVAAAEQGYSAPE
jgi:FdhE protein